MKKIFEWLNDLLTIITVFIFSLFPIAFILGGSFCIIGILLSWYFSKQIVITNFWYILISLLVIIIGFKWDIATIEAYPNAVARKKNSKL